MTRALIALGGAGVAFVAITILARSTASRINTEDALFLAVVGALGVGLLLIGVLRWRDDAR